MVMRGPLLPLEIYKGCLRWAPESVQPLLEPGCYSLWASDSDVPATLYQAPSLKLHLVCNVCQGLSTQTTGVLPAAPSYLIVIVFCQDRNDFLFLVAYVLWFSSKNCLGP